MTNQLTYQQVTDKLTKVEEAIKLLKDKTSKGSEDLEKIKKLKMIRESLISKKNILTEQNSTFVTTKSGDTKVISADSSEIDTLKNDPNIKSVEDSQGKKIKEQESDVALNLDYVGKVITTLFSNFLRDIGEEIGEVNYSPTSDSEIKVDLKFKEGSTKSYKFKLEQGKLYIDGQYLIDVQNLPSGEVQIPEEVLNSALYRHFENSMNFTDVDVSEVKVTDKGGIPLFVGDRVQVGKIIFEICFDFENKIVYLESSGRRFNGGTKNFQTLLENSNILTDELISENVEVGDKVRISKSYGGGRGTVVEKTDDFIMLDSGDSYHQGDVVNISRKLGGDLDIGHVDDEPGMLAQSAYETAVYAAKLYKLLRKYEETGVEIDFPNWWQSKLILSREYISKASHWLDYATMKSEVE
jgi:hypothetical protein